MMVCPVTGRRKLVRDSIADVIEEFEAVLNGSGLHAALAFLDRRTAHRFTVVYRFDPPTLRSVMLFDRHNPELRIGVDAPFKETYCALVVETRATFFAADTRLEESLRKYSSKEVIASYCGVLLGGDAPIPYGTLCHFDLMPRPVPLEDIPLLEAAAPLIMNNLRSAQKALRAVITPAGSASPPPSR